MWSQTFEFPEDLKGYLRSISLHPRVLTSSVCIPVLVVGRVAESVSGVQTMWYFRKRKKGDGEMEGERGDIERTDCLFDLL